MTGTMTNREREFLALLQRYENGSDRPTSYHASSGFSPQIGAALVRKDYVDRRRQSEADRHQRRVYWWIYQSTATGRAALRDAPASVA